MMTRVLDLTGKAWRYWLAGLEQPWRLPGLAWQVSRHRVHLGELLRLGRHRRWLAQAGIGTVLDVGANTGQFASAIRALLPTMQIYSFEPLPDCCERLRRTLAPRGRFQAFNVALGDLPGTATFSRNEFAEASSLLPLAETHQRAFPWARQVVPVTVEVATLDALAPQLALTPKVLLKLDVQGYELKTLAGARQTLAHVAYVLVETSYQHLYQGEPLFAEVHAWLQAEGFRFAGCLDQLASPLDGRLLQGDALFVRP
jgi:FkbM family methyltransferase